MSNDIVPKSSIIGEILKNANLPKAIGGAAGEAIARLIGNIADIPSAYIEQYVQQVKDRKEAKSIVSKSIAEATAKAVSANPALIERAVQSLVFKELRGQKNKEAVAEKAIEHLKLEAREDETPSEPVSEDWLNVFERYAESASSAKLQDLWGRVLAGEIRKPKTFSLKTLRFVAELDQATAALFEKYAPRVILGDMIVIPTTLNGAFLDDLMELQNADLLSGVGSMMNRTISSPNNTLPMNYGPNLLILLTKEAPAQLMMNCVLLTRVGQELLRILSFPYDRKNAVIAVEHLNRDKLASISLLDRTTKNGQLHRLWVPSAGS